MVDHHFLARFCGYDTAPETCESIGLCAFGFFDREENGLLVGAEYV